MKQLSRNEESKCSRYARQLNHQQIEPCVICKGKYSANSMSTYNSQNTRVKFLENAKFGIDPANTLHGGSFRL